MSKDDDIVWMLLLFYCARTKKILKSAVSVNLENALTEIIGGATAPPAPPLPTGLKMKKKMEIKYAQIK